MSLLANPERAYGELKRNKWIRWFAIFCRIALALGFIPASIVKKSGQRFTGLPSNHPLGHYFDALFLTGFYYTFIGIALLIAALLLLIPRTALLGAFFYFPIILNILVLTHATRFDGTRIVTLMLLANLFLLVWDYDRLRDVMPFHRHAEARHGTETSRFPFLFFAGVVVAIVSVIVVTNFLFDIQPGKDEAECRNKNSSKAYPNDNHKNKDCIYTQGSPLNACLNEYHGQKKRLRGPDPVSYTHLTLPT